MRNRLILIFATAAVLTAPLMAIMVANPTGETPYERFGMAAEYTYEKWKIRYPNSDFKLDSQRLLAKPSLGVLRYLDLYGYIGVTDMNIAQSNFDGSGEMAFGLGSRLHYAVFYPNLGCNTCYYPIRWYAAATWLTTKTSGSIPFGTTRRSEVTYRFQTIDLSLYGSWEFGRIKPYVGVHWTYIAGRKYIDYYSTNPQPYASVTSLFSDPSQYPKPLLGLDIDVGKGYVISLEATYFGKDETSISVGISQLYAPKREEDGKDTALERPD
jgi:hypothetical protein